MPENKEMSLNKCIHLQIENARNNERILALQDMVSEIREAVTNNRRDCEKHLQWVVTLMVSLLVLGCLVVSTINTL